MRPGSRSPGPWYGEFRNRIAFERDARREYATLRGSRGDRGVGGFVYRLVVEVPTYEHRRLTIVFPRRSPRTPHVFVNGPKVARHRFDDGSLCMWYWRDPPGRKWVFRNGLLDLIDHAAIHLFREGWFVDTGEWLGDEIMHSQTVGAA